MRGRVPPPAKSGIGLGGKLLVLIVLGWVAVGLLAAGQRHYFSKLPRECSDWATIAVTAAAGPGNYIGLNPRVTECEVPQPSK
ncbi:MULTISPECIES: hypothetical protein [Nocardia]|uniref:Uncharacterized protein n=3 Tax=Nocardia TaxID=1817 RepID=A0A4R6P4U6_NOCIG|nr:MULTISPECIES: hypothetical protein [Nocardia]KAF0836783.1 hypothetical protein FNL39_112102 [Nocardia caishijiensis]NKX89282.1 hypothetical protein [Nocardia coubleae]TDP32306.1 hypothetical protein DFR75_10693 [Nocardia ignorata]